MAEIQLSGLSTGIDTKAIVDQLMAVERRRLQAYQLDLSEVNAKNEAMGELKAGVTQYKSALNDIYKSSQLKSFDAKSADSDYITASASSSASEGTYAIQVKQLATSDRWIHEGVEHRSSLVGEGNMILSYGDKEMVIASAADTTLEGLMGLINNDPENEGIKASILQYDAGDGKEYHLVLTGEDSGSDFQIKINDGYTQIIASDVSDTGEPLLANGENASLTTKLTNLDNNTTELSLANTDTITVQGTDHYGVTVDTDINVDQYTTIEDLLKEIEDAYNGSAKASYENGQIKLTAYDDGVSGLTLTLMEYNNVSGSGASLDLPSFAVETTGAALDPAADLDAFLAGTFTEMQSAQDSKVKVDGYPLDTSTAEVQTLTSAGAVDAETFTLTYQGHTTAAIAIDADDATTLANIQTALDNLDNLTDGEITVGGDGDMASGTGIEFTFLNSAGNTGLIAMDTSGLSGSQTITQTFQGADGWLPTSGNVFSGIDGVSISLHDTTYDGVGAASDTSSYDEIQISISRDTEALEKKIEEVQEKYNALMDFKTAKASYDPETKEKGVLYGDYSISAIFSQLESPFSSYSEGFTNDDPFYQPSGIGLTINSDGKLDFDKAKFGDAIADDYNAVLDLIGAFNTGRTDNSNVGFYSVGNATEPGAYEVKLFGDGSDVTQVYFKKLEEDWSEARLGTINDDGSTVTVVGDDTYTSGEYAGFYTYPENNLTLTIENPAAIAAGSDREVDDGTTAIIYVKQGFAGESKSLADELLNSSTGRITVARNVHQISIDRINEDILDEQARLERTEGFLILKFARLESTLSMINQQMAALK